MRQDEPTGVDQPDEDASGNKGERAALVPIQEKTVEFYGDSITAALVKVEPGQAEQVYVPIRPICEYLGLDWSAQYRRIKRDEVLVEKLLSVAITATERGKGKGQREVLSLPLDLLAGFLFGLDANRVKPELKEKVTRYRRECYRVLAQAFGEETLPFAYDAGAVRQYEPNPVLLQIREQALALAKLAEQRLNSHDQMFEQVKDAFRHIRQRMDAVERVVRPGDIISDTQAAEISIKVRGLAEYLTSKLGPIDSAGKVHYQSIFGELQRRFGVTSYKLIPQRDYTEVLAFLNDWRKAADN